ncbi:MAG TPA: hypothetical protein VFX30_14815 [bacterium]|nr:hypothetical protein [bacterium]
MNAILPPAGLNRLLGVSEPLVFHEAAPVGDLHSYFTVHGMDVGATTAAVTLSVLRKGGDGNGEEEILPWEFEGDYRGRRDDLCRDLDDRVRRLTRDEGESLFQNRTQRVLLKGESSGRLFPVFHKFGRSSVMEGIGHDLFHSFGFPQPEVASDPSGSSAWIENVDARRFDGLIEEHFDEKDPRKQISEWTVTPSTGMDFFRLGRASALMFLLGNEDFHAENLLWFPEGGPVPLDMESLGQAVFFGRQHRKEREYERADDGLFILNALNSLRRGLFNNSQGIPMTLPLDATVGFALGVQKLFEAFEEDEGLRDEFLAFFREEGPPSPLYARAVLRPTMIYKLLDGFETPVPHYSVRLPREEFVGFLEGRLAQVGRFAARFRGDALGGYKPLMLWC